jgi:hypothetical protein
MNNMSIDCDCDSHPAEPLIADYGILASLDPVALDQACYDIVTKIHNDEHNNTKPLFGSHSKATWYTYLGVGREDRPRKYQVCNHGIVVRKNMQKDSDLCCFCMKVSFL